MSTAEELIAAHVSDGRKLCYAQSLGPITWHSPVQLRGSYLRTATLRCTEPLGHEGDHKDGNANGYGGKVPFADHLAGAPEPEWHNWERCVECGQSWPCGVAQVAEAMAAAQTAVPDPAPFGYEYAIMPPDEGIKCRVAYMLSPYMQSVGFYLARRALESDEPKYGTRSDDEGWEKIS